MSEVTEGAVDDCVRALARFDEQLIQNVLRLTLRPVDRALQVTLRLPVVASEVDLRPPDVPPARLEVATHGASLRRIPKGFPQLHSLTASNGT